MTMTVDMQELVRTVVQEVADRLAGRADGPCIAVLGERDEAVLAKVRERAGADCVVCFDGDDMGGREPSRHVFPYLSCSDMADLATGRAADGPAARVLELLLSGVEVSVLEFGCSAYAETAPGPLLEMYEEYEKRLASFGMKEWKRRGPDTVRHCGSLLTERDVVDLCSSGATRLLVPAGTIVTPLAAEAAQNFNCFIEKQL